MSDITLNAVELVGQMLKESGANKIEVTWCSWIDNDHDGVRIFLSPKMYSRFRKNIEPMMRYSDNPKPEGE